MFCYQATLSENYMPAIAVAQLINAIQDRFS